jgi:hypothetical protein
MAAPLDYGNGGSANDPAYDVWIRFFCIRLEQMFGFFGITRWKISYGGGTNRC